MLKNMRISLLIMSLFVLAVVQADVYRSVDEDGNVIFTDKPSADAEKIHVDEVQTVDLPETKPFTYSPPQEPKPLSTYTNVSITSPADGTTIRSNTGELTVAVAIEPVLQTQLGDKVVLYMNGQKTAESAAGSFNLTNVDRGTYTLSAAVVNGKGTELKRSPSISFSVLRFSKQAPKPTPPPPPPPPK